MTKQQIADIQRRIGTAPDGVWGPKSSASAKAHLAKLMPSPHPWPADDDLSMMARFGTPGDERNLVSIDVAGLGVEYSALPVARVRCHRLVADSLRRVLVEIAAGPHGGILKRYAGTFNHRPMRGGNRPSKHSWGVAIDLDPASNGLQTAWPDRATMPFEVAEAFAREGWKAAAVAWGRDAMHFEATR
jgi:hypothetical protein